MTTGPCLNISTWPPRPERCSSAGSPPTPSPCGGSCAGKASREPASCSSSCARPPRSQVHASHYLRVVIEHSYRRRAQQAALRVLQAADTASLKALRELVQHEHDALTAQQQRLDGPKPSWAARSATYTGPAASLDLTRELPDA